VRNKKTIGILVLVVILLSLWSAAASAGLMEYPIMPGPKGLGGTLGSVFGQISEDLGQTSDQPSSQPSVQPPVQPADVQAQPTNSSVIINGKTVPFEAYTIDSRIYFKLRDLAMALKGSEVQFEVSWDGTRNAINLLTDKPYTVTGGELTLSANTSNKNAVLSAAKVFINGTEAKLTAYVIDGLTYFKLRDVGAAVNFGISWDGFTNTINIDTSSGYVPE
jgi:hypothetical protein